MTAIWAARQVLLGKGEYRYGTYDRTLDMEPRRPSPFMVRLL